MANLPHFSQFQLKFQSGENPLLRLDVEFLRSHKKVLLRSNASLKVWKVKLDGDRLADGWEVFATDHKLKDGDVLDFKHSGDEIFHVTVSSRSDSGDTEHPSSSYVGTKDAYFDDDDLDTTYDDGEDDEDDEDEDDDEDDESEDDVGNISVRKKNKKDSSSGNSCFVTASVTRYSLSTDRLDLSRNFTMSFGEHKKPCDIDLVNEQGRKWTLVLTKNSSSGVFYIRRGWTDFCVANKLSQGDYCKFKLVENGETPMLCLCPQDQSDNGSEEAVKSTLGKVSKGKEKKTYSSFLTLKYTPSRHSTGQLSLPLGFTKENGINNSGEMTLLDKDGRKWSSYLKITGRGRSGSEWYYLRRGWRELCKANGVKINDSFVMELIKEDTNPTFKFCYKIENKGKGNRRGRKKRAFETAEETPMVEKEGRASKKGRTRVRVSNKTTTNSRKLQSTQPTSSSVSDQVATVKRGIVDTLKTVRQFQAELEIREQDLEASLQNIDALGEKILGISKYLK